jgi:catalytic LigB subunit of aromatic ring-opening dioxygenase
VARIVLGMGASHSPHVSTPLELWAARGANDPNIVGKDVFERLREQNCSWASKEITAEKWQKRYTAVQAAITRLVDTMASVRPDVVVTVGDDQHEVFSADHTPAIDIYWGESLHDTPPDPTTLNPVRRSMIWAEHAEEQVTNPTDADLGRHLIESLTAEGFDISHSRMLPESHNIGHAFNFVYRRIMNGRLVPQVPVMLNTYYPPNQPTLKRCFALGEGLRRAIDSWDTDKRVALFASGGLSHFVVDEKLDRAVLNALKDDDAETLTSFPEEVMVSGTSEIRNWVTVAGAMSGGGLGMQIVDYVPLYRSEAGTGLGAGFVQWL